uniref:LysR family transcriptional regulator n=1 Tax=Variovorax sp. BK018 TaxID=3450241 RepID=UPI004039C035
MGMNERSGAGDVSLVQLKTFERIVERGSLTAAARDLSLTQPTASRHLRDLEAHYGAVLVHRTTRSLRLTEAGKLVYEYVRQTLRAEEKLRETVSGSSRIAGKLNIAAPSGFGALVVAPLCARITHEHPDLEIDLRLSDRWVDLVEEGIDLAVRIGRLPDSSLVGRKIGDLEEVLVGHPSLVRETIRSPKGLTRLPWVAFSGLTGTAEVTLTRGRNRQTLTPITQLRVDQIIGYLQALRAGAGIGLIHRYVVVDDLTSGKLLELLPQWNLPRWPMHAVSVNRSLSARASLFYERLRLACDGLAGIDVSR